MAKTNLEALHEAQKRFPGGVNSPVRAFRAVGGHPPFIARGSGAFIEDIEGNRYIDYVGSWGPLILGHAHPDVIAAITAAAHLGTSFGAPTTRETELADLIREAFPSMERMRLVSSGTEATMSAIRLARGVTGRDLIIKFDGCYHGHGDSLLVSAGSGIATLGIPGCPGIPAPIASQTLVAPLNDLKAVERLFETYPKQIAAVIIEPVAGNIGVVLPARGYLKQLVELCRQTGALCIFDEVMTGFRNRFGGVQHDENITPDLTCLGKIVGGGMPLAVYGGRAELMSHIAPEGPVYQAGTLSGNPVAVAAGIATLTILRDTQGLYDRLREQTAKLTDGLSEVARQNKIPSTINRYGSMFTAFFTAGPVTDYASAKTADTRRFGAFFLGMLKQGVYLAPSQFEAGFVSTAHTHVEINATLEAAERVMKSLS